MKKIIFSVMAFSLILISCNKEEIQQHENSEETSVTFSEDQSKYHDFPIEPFYYDHGVERWLALRQWWSWSNSGGGSGAGGTPTNGEISDYFLINEEDMENAIGVERTGHVVDGDWNVSQEGEPEIGLIYYLYFSDEISGEIVEGIEINTIE